MFEFGNKEFRNLQEQVGKNKEDIATLKSGIKISYWVATVQDLTPLLVEGNEGKYVVVGTTNPQHLYVLTKRTNDGWIADNLGEYPAVVKGAKGDTGDTGATGSNGKSIYGVTATLPSVSAYEEGDMYLLSNANLYKVVNSAWVLQCSLKGSQGVQGPAGGTEVIANPVESATDNLIKIKIDGTIYTITGLTTAQAEWLAKALVNTTWDSNGNFLFTKNLTVDMAVYTPKVSAAEVNTNVIKANTSGSDVLFDSDIDMDGHAIDYASEISAGGPSQTTGLVANLHGDARVHGNMILDSADKLVDTEGNHLISEGNYELISDETLTEEVNTYNKTFDYDYKKVLVNIKHPTITAPLSRTLNVAGSIRFQMGLSDNYVNHFWISIENKNGRIFSDCRCSINSDANANCQVTYSANAIGGIETNSNFHNLSMNFIGNSFLSGARIKIYGVRA